MRVGPSSACLCSSIRGRSGATHRVHWQRWPHSLRRWQQTDGAHCSRVARVPRPPTTPASRHSERQFFYKVIREREHTRLPLVNPLTLNNAPANVAGRAWAWPQLCPSGQLVVCVLRPPAPLDSGRGANTSVVPLSD